MYITITNKNPARLAARIPLLLPPDTQLTMVSCHLAN